MDKFCLEKEQWQNRGFLRQTKLGSSSSNQFGLKWNVVPAKNGSQ
jgi:hypothetical protein